MRPRGAAATLVVVVCAVAVGVVAAAVVRNAAKRPCGDLGEASDFEPNTVSKVECVPAFVVNDRGKITAFLAETPHIDDEPLEWDAQERLFVSPAHGETYDITGDHRAGPGEPRLVECAYTLEDGMIVLDAPEDAPREGCAGV